MGIKNITVLGGGILGTQIAFQAAYQGFNVVIYDISAEIYSKVIEQLQFLSGLYRNEGKFDDNKIEAAYENIMYLFDLRSAVQDADLIIEAAPEDLEIKKELYTGLGRFAPEKAIFATNSSTMLPSSLMEFTGRPDKFLAMHFGNMLFKYNIVEIMGTTETDPQVIEKVYDFSIDLGMEPVIIKKEQKGYILNSLLIPLLSAASGLLVKGIADIESIDKVWRIATGSPGGPFEIYDVIGINTIYNIAKNGDMNSQIFAHYLNENYIKKGKLGYLSGEGFYRYPKEENN